MTATLILGGARSGKSSYAQKLALSLCKNPVYLATSRAWDDDHRARIQRHQEERGPEWTSCEIEKEIAASGLQDRIIVIDCVTLWLTNFFIDEDFDHERALMLAKMEAEKVLQQRNHLIFVSNEVGQSLHPPTESGRKFTDIQGFMNQYLASQAEQVVLMVAGIPLTVKGPVAVNPEAGAER